jgi:glycosyltransferase involved in cell wall biosynthesis
VDAQSTGWRSFVDRNGPAAARLAFRGVDPPAPRWVITTAVPSARIAGRWGDWHLAEALARSLRGLGQDVVVQTHDQADSLAARSRDVHLVVHGLAPVRRTAGQRHVVWVVSHPESFDAGECDAADLVVVASSRFAEHLRARSSTPVEVLLQATDVDRFRPRAPAPEHQHAVTVVAKTRNVLRQVVADALAAGIRPAIYGGGWEHLVDPSLVMADHVDNDELPVVYSSAGVVLNDHWDTMGAWGFVSNRIFDVLACGTPIISDDVAEIHELFGDAVPTYRTSAELGDLVRDALEV